MTQQSTCLRRLLKMNDKWSKVQKVTDFTRSLVVSCSTLTSVGIANGKTIPVIFVENDSENKIESSILLHQNVKQGMCSTQWGITDDSKYALFLEFSLPTENRIVLLFDILKHGYIVAHILRMQCMYLMIGTKGAKLSQHLNSPKLLIEVKNEDFLPEWNKIFKKEYTKHLKKKHKLSKKDASEIFDKITQEISIIEKMRLN